MIASFEDGSAPAFELYGLGFEHKHLPETQLYSKLTRRPIFVPSVGNYRQGMLVSVPLHLDTLPGKPGGADLHAALAKRYAGSNYVSVMPFENAATKSGKLEPEALNETNKLELYVFASEKHRQAVLVARLDNLGKGASGAAVQNMRLMLGLAETIARKHVDEETLQFYRQQRRGLCRARDHLAPGAADGIPGAASAGRRHSRTRMRRRRRHGGNAGEGLRCPPTDGSPEMAAVASRRLGRPVGTMLFHDLDAVEAYDGVWANACLLHVRGMSSRHPGTDLARAETRRHLLRQLQDRRRRRPRHAQPLLQLSDRRIGCAPPMPGRQLEIT